MKIPKALYIDDNRKDFKFPQQLDKDLYNERFKNKLFCHFYGCNAKISFNERKDGYKYFSTWNKSSHAEDCPYCVTYKDEIKRSKVLDKQVDTNLSQSHIDKIFKRLDGKLKYENNLDTTVTDEQNGSKLVNENGTKENIQPIIGDSDSSTTKPPKVYIRALDELSKRDFNKIRCVYGSIKNMQIEKNQDGSKYAYMNFDSSEVNASICFPPAFAVNNQVLIDKFDLLREYINTNSETFLCQCIGDVKSKKGKPFKGYNVNIFQAEAIRINDIPLERFIYNLVISSKL
ncbi:hypothetical protein J2Z42_001410 [Clostridium algifaecis]|uniref:Uncharacterized protein n=1 Tax=Clostridium algifaecis TaxID=1472040 RepID=A0ABS4KTQ2_9CLOT|nr:hypothetical protein [Clostridium algifaecis]MBP2032736.1 hypothetical protein [Clostridium algifaecis]